jgi:hypothetical protein
MVLGRFQSRPEEAPAPAIPAPSAARSPLPVLNPRVEEASDRIPEQIDLAELQRLQGSGEPVMVLDVRTLRSLEASDATAKGAVRIDPERAVQEAERLHLPKEAWLVAFCA